ncbi:MAG: serine/threonine-protein kinase [Anaerolineae bacterium]
MVNVATTLNDNLSRYNVKERLGSGGMATVYRATDTNLGREVAIKVLHEHLVYEDTFKDRFKQEAQFIASFNHPNIVQIYDFDTLDIPEGKLYYMVMPYLNGHTLIDVLQGCRMEEATLPHERIREIIGDLADALDYAHERGMVHRDVKPANILFNERERAILTDFGIARLANHSALTAEGSIIGTPAYMSPEQATGADVDYRSDLYALGVILFELLTGRPPFDDESTISLLLKHVQTNPPLVSEYLQMENPALDAVLNTALAKDPNNRYQSGRALKMALAEAISQEPTEARYQPSVMRSQAPLHPKSVRLPETAVLDELPVEPERQDESINRTIHTLLIQPAKQNPLGFAALTVAIIALLLIARLAQNQIDQPLLTATTENVIAEEGVMSMAGVDSMVGQSAFFTSDFMLDDPLNSYWEQTNNASIQRVIDEGQYRIRNEQAGLAITSLVNPDGFRYQDVNIMFAGEISATSASDSSAFGIVFRYQDADNYNVFAVDGMGRYSIWKRETGQWCELRTACNGGTSSTDWEFNAIINPLGEANTLTVNVFEDQIAGYVNDQQVVMLTDTTFTEGAIGIYMATTQLGAAEVHIDQYVVMPGMSPSSSSMTGE